MRLIYIFRHAMPTAITDILHGHFVRHPETSGYSNEIYELPNDQGHTKMIQLIQFMDKNMFEKS